MWKRALLGDHVDLLTGYPFKSQSYTDDGNDIRLLRGDNIGQGFLRWDAVKRWPRGNAGDYNGFNLERGDVVLAMDRPWIEAGLKWAAIVESDVPALLVQRVARMRGVNGLQTAFLRYVISSRDFTDYVKAITTGVNVPHISGPDIRKFSFRIPPEPVQMRIASVLSTYDDLIENNTQRIKILEEMARSLYREWFVNFRFPGHEKTKFVGSRPGRIPEGWRIQSVATLVDRLPNRPTFTDDQLDPAGTSLVIDQSQGEIAGFHTGEPVHQASPDTPMAIFGDHTCKLEIVSEPFSTGPNVVTFVTKALPLTYVYFAIRNLVRTTEYKRHWNDLMTKEVLVGDSSVTSAFDKFVRDLMAQQRVLRRRNRILRATRDLLLPRLISGEIDVSSLPLEPTAS